MITLLGHFADGLYDVEAWINIAEVHALYGRPMQRYASRIAVAASIRDWLLLNSSEGRPAERYPSRPHSATRVALDWAASMKPEYVGSQVSGKTENPDIRNVEGSENHTLLVCIGVILRWIHLQQCPLFSMSQESGQMAQSVYTFLWTGGVSPQSNGTELPPTLCPGANLPSGTLVYLVSSILACLQYVDNIPFQLREKC